MADRLDDIILVGDRYDYSFRKIIPFSKPFPFELNGNRVDGWGERKKEDRSSTRRDRWLPSGIEEKEGTTDSRRKEEGASLPGRKVPRRFKNSKRGRSVAGCGNRSNQVRRRSRSSSSDSQTVIGSNGGDHIQYDTTMRERSHGRCMYYVASTRESTTTTTGG